MERWDKMLEDIYKNNRILNIFFLMTIFLINFPIAIRNIVLALLLLVFLFYKIKNKDLSIYPNEFNKYVILLFIFSCLSLFKAEDLENAIDGLVSPNFRYFVFFIIAFQMIDINKINRYLYTIFCSQFIIILYGLYIDHFTNGDFFNRANSRGTFASLSVIFSLSLLINKKNEIKLFEKLLLFLSVLFGLIAVSTYSRGAILGFIIAIFVFSFLMILKEFSFKKLFIVIMILIILLLPILSSDYILGRFSHIKNISSDNSIVTRLNMWKFSFELIEKNKIFGIGVGNFYPTVYNHAQAFLKNNMWPAGHTHPHNFYIQIALEQGIISLIIFFVGIYKAYKMAFINYLNYKIGSDGYYFGLTFIAMLTSILTHSFFDFAVKRSYNGILIIIFLIINYYYYRNLNNQN